MFGPQSGGSHGAKIVSYEQTRLPWTNTRWNASEARFVRSNDVEALSAMFAACGQKSLYLRYWQEITGSPGTLSAQICSNNPSSEIAVVAEIKQAGRQEIIGVGELFADIDYEAAEYAVIVADPWQGKGLGSALTDYCLKVARQQHIKRIVVEFSPSNVRIIRILNSRGFDLKQDQQHRTISGEKVLG